MSNDLKMYPELLYYRTKVKKMSINETINGLNMSKSTYLRIESGARELTLTEACIIAKNLELPIGDLFPKIFNQKVDKK